MLKIVITGGAGFIGSQLAILLSNLGYHVTAIDDLSGGYLDNLYGGIKKFSGTFLEKSILDSNVDPYFKDADIIFHFAGISSLPSCQSDPFKAISVNTAGTAKILELARRYGAKKVVFSSTSAVYENSSLFPTEEKTELTNPNLIYSLSKLQSEQICQSFQTNYGLPFVILRFFNVYGPHQDYRRKSPPLIGYIIRELSAGKQPILHSDGHQKRDYVYVDDVLKICLESMLSEKADNSVVNLCSGTSYSVREIYSLINKYFGNQIEPLYHESAAFWANYSDLYTSPYPLKSNIVTKEVNKFSLGSTSQCERLLGFSPKTPLDVGIQSIIEYIKNDRKLSTT